MSQLAENVHPLHDDLEMPEYAQIQGTPEPYIWGITGASGGAGVTSLATQFAYWLGKPKKSHPNYNPNVCLLELDFENGSLSHHLDSAPKVRFEAFCQSPDRMDQDLVKSWVTKTAYGFSVFSIPTALNGNQRVNADLVLSCLDHICGLFDYIVMDIPLLWAPWTHAALGAADRVALVTELNIPSLHQARRRSEDLIGAVDELNKTDFILNKYERRSFRGSLKLGDAERALDAPYVNTVSMANEHVRESLNRGEPVGVSHSESRFVRDSNDIFDDWLKQALARHDALQAGL